MERFIISRVSRFVGWCAINRLWNDDDDECLASNAIYCLIRQNPLLGHPARFQTSRHFNQSGWRGQMTNAFRSGRNENSGLPCITNRKASTAPPPRHLLAKRWNLENSLKIKRGLDAICRHQIQTRSVGFWWALLECQWLAFEFVQQPRCACWRKWAAPRSRTRKGFCCPSGRNGRPRRTCSTRAFQFWRENGGRKLNLNFVCKCQMFGWFF